MRNLIGLVLIALSLIGSALAQDNQHCHGVGPYTTESTNNRRYDTTVCEFSDGRANVTRFVDGDYSSTWYTEDEWRKARPVLMAEQEAAQARIVAHNEEVAKRIQEESAKQMAQIVADSYERDAHEFRNQRSCEKSRKDFRIPGQQISFVWRDGGCHYEAKLGNGIVTAAPQQTSETQRVKFCSLYPTASFTERDGTATPCTH